MLLLPLFWAAYFNQYSGSMFVSIRYSMGHTKSNRLSNVLFRRSCTRSDGIRQYVNSLMLFIKRWADLAYSQLRQPPLLGNYQSLLGL